MARKSARPITDAALLLLGLVAEMPRHGYELEQEIDERGMREWTQIGFSSVYFVLGQLEDAGFVRAKTPAGAKARKTFSITAAGRRALVARTATALQTYRPTYSSLLLGMVQWPVLEREQALEALAARGMALDEEIARLEAVRIERQPLPDYVEAVFEFSLGQLQAEAGWVANTLGYMETKPWLD